MSASSIRAFCWALWVVVSLTTVSPDAQVPEVSPEATIRNLVEAGHYDDAASQARAWLATIEAIQGDRAAEAAAAIDLLVDALCRGGQGAQGEARALAERSLAIRRQALSSSDPEVASSLARLADVDLAAGNYDQAVTEYREALEHRERMQRGDEAAVARTLDGLGDALRLSGRYDEALDTLARAQAIKERTFDRSQVEMAATLERLAPVRFQKGSYKDARADLERALSIREKAMAGHPDLAHTYYLFGDLLWFEDDIAEAQRWYARALALAEGTLGPAHPSVALYLRNLGNTAELMGDLDTAQSQLERALETARKTLGPEHPEVAWYLNDLAATCWSRGEYRDSRAYYEGALQIIETRLGPEHLRAATVLNNLAILDERLGDLEGAVALHKRALAIWERQFGAAHPYVGRSVEALGDLAVARDRDGQARQLYERALAIRERKLGSRHGDVARTLAHLAAVYARLNQPAQASRLLTRALDIWKQSEAPDDRDVAYALTVLAGLQVRRGELGDARDSYEHALALRRRVLGPSHPDVAASESSLAAVLVDLGEVAGALTRAIDAESISRAHLRLTMRDLPERVALLYAAARPRGLDVALSILSSERRTSIDSSEALDAGVRSRALVLDEMAARQRGDDRVDPTLTALNAALASARQRLANLVVRGPEGLDPERFAALVGQARESKERAERALAERSEKFRVALAREGVGLAEVRLALAPGTALVSFVRYSRHLPRGPTPVAPGGPKPRSSQSGKTAPVAASAHGSRLPPGDAPAYAAFVLRSGASAPVVVPLGDAGRLDALVARWRTEAGAGPLQTGRSIRETERIYLRTGEALRRRVWDPITGHLDGLSRVFIVPDGALNLVNLAALPMTPTGYVVESEPVIHYLSAERDLVRQDGPAHAGRGLLALGGAAFNSSPALPVEDAGGSRQSLRASGATDPRTSVEAPSPDRRALGLPASDAPAPRSRASCGSLQSMRFQPLPDSRREIEEVIRLWRETDAAVLVLDGSRASEPIFKEKAAGWRVLHLATHGFFLRGTCASAKGARDVGGLWGDTPARPLAMEENPLLLSGLAMAGANRRASADPDDDDGILTAEEVTALDLAGVEWAVLSACDTGIGEIKAGEGVFGLRRAFQLAGARTVIMSLWSVEDWSTMRWMRALYEARLRARLDTADAVREASLTVLRERREKGASTHPFFWAGFVAAGDWR